MNLQLLKSNLSLNNQAHKTRQPRWSLGRLGGHDVLDHLSQFLCLRLLLLTWLDSRDVDLIIRGLIPITYPQNTSPRRWPVWPYQNSLRKRMALLRIFFLGRAGGGMLFLQRKAWSKETLYLNSHLWLWWISLLAYWIRLPKIGTLDTNLDARLWN